MFVFRQDETEARVVHRTLCELVEKQDPSLLGGDLGQVRLAEVRTCGILVAVTDPGLDVHLKFAFTPGEPLRPVRARRTR